MVLWVKMQELKPIYYPVFYNTTKKYKLTLLNIQQNKYKYLYINYNFCYICLHSDLKIT